LPDIAVSEGNKRELVQLPEMMQQHMLSNMRDHLLAFNEILIFMASGELDKAADIAEYRLGMSSLELHGASHMAPFMPQGMQQAGTSMRQSASRFALKAQEGEALPAYAMLSALTTATQAIVSAEDSDTSEEHMNHPLREQKSRNNRVRETAIPYKFASPNG
jgi:hypothetical protein